MATTPTYQLPGISGKDFDSIVSAMLSGKIPVTGSCGTKSFFIDKNQWKPKPVNLEDDKKYKYYATIRLSGVYYTGGYSTAVFFVEDGTTAVKQVKADYKYSDDGKYITVYSNTNIKLYFTFLSSNQYWKEAITVADMLYYKLNADNTSCSVGVKDLYKPIIKDVPESALQQNADGIVVNAIDANGFSNCTQLQNVRLPSKISQIGDRAFQGCSKLTTFTIPSGVTAIGEYAFYSCSGLTKVSIGKTVTSVGTSAFSGCEKLNSVHITDVTNWCGIDFGSADANPLYYAKDLYLNNLKVERLQIGESNAYVDVVKKFAFINCSLTELFGYVGSVKQQAFEGCKNLVTADLRYCAFSKSDDQESVFRNCSSLQSIRIGADSTGIPFAFAAEDNTKINSHLQYVSLWSNDQSGETSGFEYYLLGDGRVSSDESLAKVQLTSIGDYAFKRHSAQSVFIPSTVSDIGASAFSCDISDDEYATARASYIYIADGITNLQIGTYAFNRFVNVQELHIPVRTTRIGSYAFNDIGFGTYIKTGVVTKIYIYRPYTTVSGGTLTSDDITVADAYPFGNPEVQRPDGTYYKHQLAFQLYAPMFEYSVSYCYSLSFDGYSTYTSATNWTAYYHVHGNAINSRFVDGGFNPANVQSGGATA